MASELQLANSYIAQCLSDLKQLKQTNIPIYSFQHHQRMDETKYLYGATIIIGTAPAASSVS